MFYFHVRGFYYYLINQEQRYSTQRLRDAPEARLPTAEMQTRAETALAAC